MRSIYRLLAACVTAGAMLLAVTGVAQAVTYYTHTGHCIATPSSSNGWESFSNYGTQSVAPYRFGDVNNPTETGKWTIKMVYNGTTLKTWTHSAPLGQTNWYINTPPPSGWRGAASLLHMNVLFDPYVGGTCSYNIQAAPAP